MKTQGFWFTAVAVCLVSPAWAQITDADRPKLDKLINQTLAEYRESAKAGGAAAENLKHVERMLDSVQARRGGAAAEEEEQRPTESADEAEAEEDSTDE